ncbi:MAG: Zn-dependent protease with chaperone function, partial [Pseudanabaena sp. RU_4_16]|nr:Zn-dependent protease with chaperone function [Pseudanabaena sp. RU_4_16]
MFQGSLRYPNYRKVIDTDLVGLLIDPYASTLCGQPVQIPGELMGYGRKDNQLGYTLKLEDQSGLIYLNYLPNLKVMFSKPNEIISQMETLVGESVLATGW